MLEIQKVESDQETIDESLFKAALAVIRRYVDASNAVKKTGNTQLGFTYQCRADGAYRLWIEMTSGRGYKKYSKDLLSILG